MLLTHIRSVIITALLMFLGMGFTLVVTMRFADPTSVYETAARERGGLYLGRDGVVLQDKSNTCGPAALKMILDECGKTVSLAELEEGRRSSDSGWSMQSLKELAELHGLSAEGWRLNVESLRKKRFPVILFLENNHFIVADGVDTVGFLYVRDPAIGRMKIHRHALTRIWKGETLVFGECQFLGG